MFDKLFQDEDTFLKTEVHNKEAIDEEDSDAMLKAFLDTKKEELNEGLQSTLDKITKHAEEIQKLNENLKKLGVSQTGNYNQIKEASQTILWTVEFVEQSQGD